jgi:hypothetical protein
MVDTDAATSPKHNAILPLALGYTPAIHTDSLLAPHASRSPSPGLQPLLLLHLSPRRKNHLLPLALQVRLALGAVLAPRLGLGLLLLLLSRCVLPDLRGEVVSCDEIGVRGFRRSGSTSRCRGRAGRGDSERCRSLYSTPLAVIPQHNKTQQPAAAFPTSEPRTYSIQRPPAQHPLGRGSGVPPVALQVPGYVAPAQLREHVGDRVDLGGRDARGGALGAWSRGRRRLAEVPSHGEEGDDDEDEDLGDVDALFGHGERGCEREGWCGGSEGWTRNRADVGRWRRWVRSDGGHGIPRPLTTTDPLTLPLRPLCCPLDLSNWTPTRSCAFAALLMRACHSFGSVGHRMRRPLFL